MKYWDASALLPLVVDEPGTALARAWLRADPHLITWSWTTVELASAVERRAREGALTRARRREILQRFATLSNAWDEVAEADAVRKRALALLARHALRAADAGQLGAALVAAEDDPASLPFVCLDRRLADAADREGMPVLTWPEQAT